MNPIIYLENVSHRVKHKNSFFELRNISLVINSGELALLMGPTGSGKTSILQLIVGFDKADTGQIRVCGHDVKSVDFSFILDKCISYMPQKPLLIPGLTVRENILIATQGYSDGSSIAAELGVTSLLDKNVVILSGGEQRLASFIAALARDKPILLLDEPTIYLDRNRRKKLVEYLIKLKSSKTFLIATHDNSLVNISDSVYLLEDGTVRKVK